jgi:hypothetical protein
MFQALLTNNWVLVAMLAAFIALVITNFVVIGNATSQGEDNASEMKSAIVTVISINAVIIALLGLVAYSYTRANIGTESTYLMIVTHLTLLLSLTAVGISAVQKLQ